MIDFACRSISTDEVIKCSLSLTKADLRVLKLMLDNPADMFESRAIAKRLGLNLTTVQRAVKKLHARGLISRKQNNLDSGGYVFVYQSGGKQALRDEVRRITDEWSSRVDSALKKL